MCSACRARIRQRFTMRSPLRPEIETILVRNEQAGAFMADGYARVTGKPGYICTTAGPGATNALTGIAEAWADSTPVVLLAGQVNADRLDIECGAYHEIDLDAIFRPATKFSDRPRCRTHRGTLRPSLHGGDDPTPPTGRLDLAQDLMRSEIQTTSQTLRPRRANPPARPNGPRPRRGVAFERGETDLARRWQSIFGGRGGRDSHSRRSSPRGPDRHNIEWKRSDRSARFDFNGTRAIAPGAGPSCRTPTRCSRSAAGLLKS